MTGSAQGCDPSNTNDVLTEILGRQGQGDLTTPSAVQVDGSFHFRCCEGSPNPPAPSPGAPRGGGVGV